MNTKIITLVGIAAVGLLLVTVAATTTNVFAGGHHHHHHHHGSSTSQSLAQSNECSKGANCSNQGSQISGNGNSVNQISQQS